MAPADLAADTGVTRLDRAPGLCGPPAPGWYLADLPDSWSYVSPSGGVLMTVAMRAMIAELCDPALRPVSATTLFMSPVPSGPMEIRVEVLRHGRAATQLRAALSSTRAPGPGLEVSATFARDRELVDVYGIDAPSARSPEEADDAGDRHSRTRPGWKRPFFSNYDMRLAIGEPVWEKDWPPGDARMAIWYRYRVPQRSAGGCLDPLAIPPIADTMPSALHRQLGPAGPRFYAPSLDLTVHFLDPSRGDWYLVDVRCQRARAGYATADAEIWDEHGKLIATATQTMMLRMIKDKP